MIQYFTYKGIKYHVVPQEEITHYADSDKNIFFLGDIFKETSVRNYAENNEDAFIGMGQMIEPCENRMQKITLNMSTYRGFYDRVYSQDVKKFYFFVQD